MVQPMTLRHPRRKRAYHRPVKRIPCEAGSRPVGYLRPTSHYADHKRLEFEQRKTYRMDKAMERITDGTLARH